MTDNSEQILSAICEMRDLIRLMAEPQIAARDQNLRNELTRIVGKSILKQKSVLLMDGVRTQTDIYKQAGINQGDMSRLVKQLVESKLLIGETKKPKLAISVPSNFFEKV